MSTVLTILSNLEWLRVANKYLENLQVSTVSEYGTITTIRDNKDDSFNKEFDYIASNMG